MTQYNNSYNSLGLYGDPEGDEQEMWEANERRQRQWAKKRAAYLESPYCSIDHCQNHIGTAKGTLCAHHRIQTYKFGMPEMWVRK